MDFGSVPYCVLDARDVQSTIVKTVDIGHSHAVHAVKTGGPYHGDNWHFYFGHLVLNKGHIDNLV